MTKSELIAEISKDAELTKTEAEKVVKSLIESIKKTLKKGDKVTLTGFGSFQISSRKARTGINPQTGEKINIKASKVPKFKPGQNLKDAVK
ncbi:HU family DNA-binding protein [Thermodesulfobacteriota bacterium]